MNTIFVKRFTLATFLALPLVTSAAVLTTPPGSGPYHGSPRERGGVNGKTSNAECTQRNTVEKGQSLGFAARHRSTREPAT